MSEASKLLLRSFSACACGAALSTAALMHLALPVKAQQSAPEADSVDTPKPATLVLSSNMRGGHGRGALALIAIPVESMEKCEEQGAMIIASDRLTAPRLGFECVESR